MASERVEPCRAEREKDTATGLDHPAHGPEHVFRVAEVLEPIQRNDEVYRLVGPGDELAAFRHTGIPRRSTGGLERLFENVDADHAGGAPQGHLDRLATDPAAEVGHDGPSNLPPEPFAKQDLELASTSVCAAVAVSLPSSTFAKVTEEMVRQRPADQPGVHHGREGCPGKVSVQLGSRPSSKERPRSHPPSVTCDTDGGDASSVSVGSSKVTMRTGSGPVTE